MNLKFIKTNVCPKCGCNIVVRESVQNNGKEVLTHCNGTKWESRQFLCGLEINYEPNFSRESMRGVCRNDMEYKKQLQKIEDDKEKVSKFCKENNIDEKMSGRILDSIKYM